MRGSTRFNTRGSAQKNIYARELIKLYQKKYMLSPPSIWQEKSREVAPEVGRWICGENIHVIEKEERFPYFEENNKKKKLLLLHARVLVRLDGKTTYPHGHPSGKKRQGRYHSS